MRPIMAAIFLLSFYLLSCNKQEHGVGVGLYSDGTQLGAHYIDTLKFLPAQYLLKENDLEKFNV